MLISFSPVKSILIPNLLKCFWNSLYWHWRICALW